MRPYYQRHGITLYHGECIEVLDRLRKRKLSAVITSPPYAQQRKNTYGGIPEARYPSWTCSWMAAASRHLSERSSVLINIREHRTKRNGMSDYVHRTRLAIREHGWFEVDEIPWIKPNSTPTAPNTLPRRSWERLLWFSRSSIPECHSRDESKQPSRKRDYRSLQKWQERIGKTGSGSGPDYQHKPSRRPNWIIQAIGDKIEHGYHPARFPVGLAEQCVALFGNAILDPFAGAFTTGLACLKAGKRCIGIEQSEAYCEMSARRIDAAIDGGYHLAA